VILFVSDLHLCSSRPEICRIFFDFLAGPARRAEALYILGDIRSWAGDDDAGDPLNASVITALQLRRCARVRHAGTATSCSGGDSQTLRACA
jgi:UDP-2,3-diacylglucosamine pyrophosphatase LpxH